MARTKAFSFRFKCLSGSPARLSTMLHIVRYGVAGPDALVQYRDVAPGFYLSRRSTQVQTQSIVLPSPRLELNWCDRGFGDDIVLSVSFSVFRPRRGAEHDP
jgi:hypothetical protein